MASAGYYRWIDAGKPYTLSTWLDELQAQLQGYGFTVYDYPDYDHLVASRPEDHTPFSVTGWPQAALLGQAYAIDIMPESGVSLPAMARQIIADKRGGLLPGLKYMNWTDEAGRCWHTSWQSAEATVSSVDKGHIHLSGRTDFFGVHLTGGYDLVARMNGDDMSEKASRIIEAWSVGLTKTSTGEQVEPVVWQLREDDFQAQTREALKKLSDQVAKLETVTAVIDPEVIKEAVKAALREGTE